MYRFRFISAYAALALFVAGAGYGAYRGIGLRGPAPAGATTATCPSPTPKVGTDPVMTAVTFIHAAVERVNPKAAFALATPALRGNTTCKDWAEGKLPVKPFRQIDWNQSQYKVETRASGQLVLQVLLTSSTLPEKPSIFVLELHQVGAQWRVGYWGPADIEI
jgi:hypothetical protein